MKKAIWIAFLGLVALGVGVTIFYFYARSGSADSAATIEKPDSTPTSHAPPEVAVAKVVRGNLSQSLNITAEFQPYQVVDVHAKVSGYIQQISVDIGDIVHQGETIAKLEIPEIDADIAKAQAALNAAQQQVASSQALYDNANVICTRLHQAAKQDPHLIAQQELDTAKSEEDSKQADVQNAQQKVGEAKADVNRLQAMVDYSNVTAPFDGVVTKRFLNSGALVQGGITGATTVPLVTVAEMNHLRLVFPVPESAVASITIGLEVEVHFVSSSQVIHAKISRFSHNVDLDTRTMHTEADIDNTDGRIFPGTFATVIYPMASSKNALLVPLQAIVPGDEPYVMVLNGSGNVEKRAVSIGLETANRAEITSGLAENDLVVIGSNGGVQVGEAVTPKIVDSSNL